MGIRAGMCFAILMALSMVYSCTQRPNPEAEQANVKHTIDQLVRAFENKDTTLVPGIFAHDPDMVSFGTDSAEHWVGWEALRQNVDQEIAAYEDTKITIRDQAIKIHPSGKVAWFSEIADWDLKAGGKPVHLTGTRITGVLEQRDGNWVIVQFHGSVPVSGQAAPN